VEVLQYLPRLMLGHRRQDVQRLVGMRIIDRNELKTGIHERCDKGQVSGQPIQLGNDQFGLVFAAGIERPRQFWPVGPLAAFDFDEFGRITSSAARAFRPGNAKISWLRPEPDRRFHQIVYTAKGGC
jgi:hypothetical protein